MDETIAYILKLDNFNKSVPFILFQHHPNSMKSDSGGEMGSCRSSDSELERELHEKEREIQERDRELTNCYRTIAERDTELIKVRLECQRLLEDNRNLRDQLNDLKAYTNPKKQMEMEKEIDSLKWHLSVVSKYFLIKLKRYILVRITSKLFVLDFF